MNKHKGGTVMEKHCYSESVCMCTS